MQERPLGLTALAVASVAMALYGMVAGIAMMLGGAIGTFAGSQAGVAVLVLGAILFGMGMAAFFVGYGFWMSKSWSWVGGLVTSTVLIVGVLSMGLIGAAYTSLALPVVLGLAMIWYLLRPSVRAQLIAPADAEGETASDDAAVESVSTPPGMASEQGI